jgi:hypothetical protein
MKTPKTILMPTVAFAVATLIMTILKVVGVAIPWWLVLAPLWIPVASLVAVLFIIAILVSLLTSILIGVFTCIIFVALIAEICNIR